ncbi:hypothetical protein HDU79_008959 [Rhizoclosmatium sp. JEL0117]|nr:hypothetical protein HDU79_008959 [Rhizoclosmatium sp. JEL0117]
METGSRPVETVKPAKRYAPVKMVEKATGTGDEYTSDEDVGKEDDTESDQDVQQPRRGRRWIRKEEHPSVSNWKFPKHQIDECIQVNLDAEPVPQKQRTRTTTTSSHSSDHFSSPSQQSRSPKAKRAISPHIENREANRFNHFTIPVHDLVPSKKGKEKKQKQKTNAPVKQPKAAESKVGGMVGAVTKGEESGTENQPPQKSVLEIVNSFLGDVKVMRLLDLSVLKDEEENE